MSAETNTSLNDTAVAADGAVTSTSANADASNFVAVAATDTSATDNNNDNTAATTATATTTTGSGSKKRGGSKQPQVTTSSGTSAASNVTSGSNAPLDAVTIAAISTATQHMSAAGYHGLATLLISALHDNNSNLNTSAAVVPSNTDVTATSNNNNSTTTTGTTTTASGGGIIPSIEQVEIAAKKAMNEQPVWVHWSKQDMAPQIKTDSTRLTATGALRGYRMARASHGVSPTTSNTTNKTAATTNPTDNTSNCSYYYYECIILPGPSAMDIISSLPSNARLGAGLKEQLQRAVEYEQQQQQSDINNPNANKKRKISSTPPPPGVTDNDKGASATVQQTQQSHQVGGHVRIGWSMRTGDLQAPVGYDKWSYAIRDINGSIIHNSKRNDYWGGLSFTAGDVIGCFIALENISTDSTNKNTNNTNNEQDVDNDNNQNNNTDNNQNTNNSNNHIRFFKNGECMGQFIVSNGKREGGEAFVNIEKGTYYPAVSCYMGGSIRANFGPYWIYNPTLNRKKCRLPANIAKHIQPIGNGVVQPTSPELAIENNISTIKLFRKLEHQNALKNAIKTEAQIQCNSYTEFLKQHIQEIKYARIQRNLSISDLPSDDNNTNIQTTTTTTTTIKSDNFEKNTTKNTSTTTATTAPTGTALTTAD